MLRNHHTVVLTDAEYAQVIAALGRVDDPGGFDDSINLYARLLDKAPSRVQQLATRYYRFMTFSARRFK